MTPKMGASTRMKLEVPGLSEATAQIGNLNTALGDLKTALTTLNTTSYTLSQGISKLMGSITSGATQATKAVQGLSAATGGSPSGSSSTTGSGGTASASQAIAAASGGGGSGWNIAQSMFSGATSDFAKDVLMFPLRFMTGQINTNRQLGLTSAASLGPQAFAQNLSPGTMMTSLSKLPGSVMGGPTDLLSLMNIARQVGGFTDLSAGATLAGRPSDASGTQMNAPRAAGFLRGVREAQMMNPGASVTDIATTIGSFSASAAAQKQSMMMSGGAFGMIGGGGRQRSISEWAENILKFLSSQRPGQARGSGFTRGELLAQYFPGSNIDAWFDANGVPQGMKEYWWTYALGKSALAQGPGEPRITGGSPLDFSVGGSIEKGANFQNNQAYQRLKSTTSSTRGQFGLAGTLSGTYANKEVANTWFNDMMSQMLQQIIPQALTGPMSFMQYLPDDIQDLLMTALNRTGIVGAGVGGLLGYGGAAKNITDYFGDFLGGDVGDVGDWSGNGATSTAGLHPDMRRKVNAMMEANPRIRVNSGLRDRATQQKLKRKGGNRVSGKPSAHTRGMAADLGPSSEYPWIVANARKFGLRSGNHAGEPWHVGLGDDIGELNLPSLGSIWEALTGEGAGQASSIASIVGSIMQLVTGAFGSRGGIDDSKLAFLGTDLYDQMYGSGSFDLSKSGLTPKTSSSSGGAAPGTFTRNPSTLPGAGGSGTLQSFFSEVLSGLGVPVTADNLAKMGAVAKQEGYRAGAYNPWNSNSGPGTNYNVQGIKNYPDAQTGITQTIALLSSPTRNRPAIIANLRSGGSFNDFINATEAYYHTWAPGEQIRPNAQQGADYLSTPLGDIEAMMMPSGGSTRISYGGPVFHNQFTITGGGGGTGIDVKRTATMLADQLEDQMKQRAARRN